MTLAERRKITKQQARKLAHSRDMHAAAHRLDRRGLKAFRVNWTPLGLALRRLGGAGHLTVRDFYR